MLCIDLFATVLICNNLVKKNFVFQRHTRRWENFLRGFAYVSCRHAATVIMAPVLFHLLLLAASTYLDYNLLRVSMAAVRRGHQVSVRPHFPDPTLSR